MNTHHSKKEEGFEIRTTSEAGSEHSKPMDWQWVMQSIFFIPAFIILILAKILLRTVDILMFDTHHIELKVTPKR